MQVWSGASKGKLWGKKRQAVAAESTVAAQVTVVPKPQETKDLIGKPRKQQLKRIM